MAGLCPGTTHRSRFRCHRCFVSMRQQWFTHVRLLIAHPPRYSETSPAALTTPALDRRSLRWFGISACTATPEDLPPSLAQHGSCRRSSTSSSSLPFRTHVGAGNPVVAGQAACRCSLTGLSRRVDFTAWRCSCGWFGGSGGSGVWVPMIRSWVLTRGFALLPGTRNRYEIWYTRTQHRPPSRQVNDHGRVSGTHRVVSLVAGRPKGSV